MRDQLAALEENCAGFENSQWVARCCVGQVFEELGEQHAELMCAIRDALAHGKEEKAAVPHVGVHGKLDALWRSALEADTEMSDFVWSPVSKKDSWLGLDSEVVKQPSSRTVDGQDEARCGLPNGSHTCKLGVEEALTVPLKWDVDHCLALADAGSTTASTRASPFSDNPNGTTGMFDTRTPGGSCDAALQVSGRGAGIAPLQMPQELFQHVDDLLSSTSGKNISRDAEASCEAAGRAATLHEEQNLSACLPQHVAANTRVPSCSSFGTSLTDMLRMRTCESARDEGRHLDSHDPLSASLRDRIANRPPFHEAGVLETKPWQQARSPASTERGGGISDVWARFHPSRNGTPSWWEEPLTSRLPRADWSTAVQRRASHPSIPPLPAVPQAAVHAPGLSLDPLPPFGELRPPLGLSVSHLPTPDRVHISPVPLFGHHVPERPSPGPNWKLPPPLPTFAVHSMQPLAGLRRSHSGPELLVPQHVTASGLTHAMR